MVNRCPCGSPVDGIILWWIVPNHCHKCNILGDIDGEIGEIQLRTDQWDFNLPGLIN